MVEAFVLLHMHRLKVGQVNIVRNILQLNMWYCFLTVVPAQNRNQYLSGGLHHTENRHPHVKVIEQKFLETGHTQMECDAMHSSIEHAKKCTSIFIPDQWDTVIYMALRSKQYTVVPLRYESLYDLKCHKKNNYKNFKIDVDNNQVNWL